ncbi:MAG: lipopolysaccharide biosynthesis protein, partial [Planctomycetes bacterium]|nr:lipopolysaccharide biosynthesis protein [Planctomycetota bacterium]
MRQLTWKNITPVGCTFIDQGITSAVHFLVMMTAARCLEQEKFALFSLGWTIYIFSVGLQNSLLSGPMKVLLPEYKEEEEAYLHRLDHLQSWLSFLNLMLTLLLSLCFQEYFITILGAGSLISARMQLSWVRQQFLAQLKAPQAMLCSVISGTPVLLMYFYWAFHRSPIHPGILWISISAFSLLAWLFTRAKRQSPPLSNKIVIKAHYNYGRWLFGGHMALWGSNQIYPFLIAGMMGLKEVAVLNACRSLLGLNHIIFQGLNSFCVPRLRRTKLSRPDLFFRHWLNYSALSALVVFPILISLFLFPGPALSFVFSNEYNSDLAKSILSLFSLIYIIVYLNQMLAIALQSLKIPQAGFYSYLCSAVFTLTLGPLLIHRYGLHGALSATTINYLIILIGSLLYL